MSDASFLDAVDRFAASCSFQESFRKSVEVINDALRLYGCSTLGLSFSGGKEACVMLFLLKYCILKSGLTGKILCDELKVIYFADANGFPEVESFIADLQKDLDMHMTSFSCSYKEGMGVAVRDMGIRGIFMGVRVGDPYTSSVEHFQPSSPSWPAFMRINPVTHWRYGEVWEFLRGCDLPYCCLYDQGYTSLGNRRNTVKNDRLKVETVEGGATFLPAYMLGVEDEHLERMNRTRTRSASADEHAALSSAPKAGEASRLRGSGVGMVVRVISGSLVASCELMVSLQRLLDELGVLVSNFDTRLVYAQCDHSSGGRGSDMTVGLLRTVDDEGFGDRIDVAKPDIVLCCAPEVGAAGESAGTALDYRAYLDVLVAKKKDSLLTEVKVSGWDIITLGDTLFLLKASCGTEHETSSSLEACRLYICNFVVGIGASAEKL